MPIKNKLPNSYKNWNHLLSDLKQLFGEEAEWPASLIYESSNEATVVEVDVEYAKARAWEEIGTLPNNKELERVFFTLKHATMHQPGSGRVHDKPEALNFCERLWYLTVPWV